MKTIAIMMIVLALARCGMTKAVAASEEKLRILNLLMQDMVKEKLTHDKLEFAGYLSEFCSDKKSGHYYADPTSCQKFVICSGKYAISMSCPENLLFNVQKSQCDHPTKVNCTIGKCREYKGWCLNLDGWDQNEGTQTLTSKNKAACLAECRTYVNAKGCEWTGLTCIIHTKDVSKGSGTDEYTCWVFPKSHGVPIGVKKTSANEKVMKILQQDFVKVEKVMKTTK